MFKKLIVVNKIIHTQIYIKYVSTSPSSTMLNNFDTTFLHASSPLHKGGLGLSDDVAVQFALNSSLETGISFYIPRVFNNINHHRLKRAFIDMNWGYVDRVDVIHKGKYKQAFIHFQPNKFNTKNMEAMNAIEALKSGKSVNIVYDDPWFWILNISYVEKPSEAPTPDNKPVVNKPVVNKCVDKPIYHEDTNINYIEDNVSDDDAECFLLRVACARRLEYS